MRQERLREDIIRPGQRGRRTHFRQGEARQGHGCGVGQERFLETDKGEDSINIVKKPIYSQDFKFISPNVPACTNQSGGGGNTGSDA